METALYIVVGIVGGSLLFRFYNSWRLRRAGVVQVNVAETEKLIRDGALVVDVREGREYASGRIPRARHIPLRDIGSRLGDLERERDRAIVVSCRSGKRSAAACVYLCRQGFARVYNLKGGMNAWARADRKVER